MAKLAVLFFVLFLVKINGESTSGNTHNINDFLDSIKGLNLGQTPNESDSVSRPCAVYDTNCIRNFFAANSNCKLAYNPIPDPLFRDFDNLYYPGLNISVTQVGVKFTGFQTNIEDFFLHKESKQALLQVRYKNLNFASTIDFYRFQRDGKEPAVTTSRSTGDFPNFSVTTVFPDYENLDLAKSETFFYLDVIPSLILDPSGGIHPDPTVAVMYANFNANPVRVAQEAFATVSTFLAGYFVQYNVCDFGLKLF